MNFSPKAVSNLMGHAKELITVDVYGDNAQLITDNTEALDQFIQEITLLPYEEFDAVQDSNENISVIDIGTEIEQMFA